MSLTLNSETMAMVWTFLRVDERGEIFNLKMNMAPKMLLVMHACMAPTIQMMGVEYSMYSEICLRDK